MAKIEELRRELIKYCYWYYVKSQPLISDYNYDMRFKELEKLEEGLEEIPKDSPSQVIWGDSESQYPDWAKNN